MTIRVVVADDQTLVRAGFRLILDSRDDLEVVGEAADGATAVDLVAELVPDVVLMDVRMPVVDGIEATRRIVAAGLPTRIIILTTYDLDEYVYAALPPAPAGSCSRTSVRPSWPNVLEHEPTRTRDEGGVDVLVEVVGREDDDAGGQSGSDDPSGGLDAIEDRHPHIDQRDIGDLRGDHLDGGGSVRCLTDDLDVVATVEDQPEPGAHERLIVDDRDADRHLGPTPSAVDVSSGRRAWTPKPPCAVGPVSTVPPSIAARSRIPASPRP